MKIFVKTLKGTHFEVEVKLEDKIADVKKSIESVQGAGVYPAAQQMLIHQGKVLKDETTLEENQVAENSFVVIMLAKTKTPTGGSSTLTTAPSAKTSAPVPPAATQPLAAPQPPASPQPPAASSTASSPAPAAASLATLVTAGSESDVYGQAASNLVAGTNLEGTIQQILDMGGGTWDRETVLRALRAAFNNPERAIEYLYSGIPDVAPVAPAPALGSVIPPAQPQTELTVPAALTSSGPNANPLDLFPQGLPSMGSNTAGAGTLDFLRNSQQFQALRTMVQTNPQILQPMLQELGKQNPNLMRLIQDHQSDFLRLINEPAGGVAGAGVAEGNTRNQTDAGAVLPQSVTVTPEERQAIDRLEAMGFERALVLQVFFACNKNEELAANYLLDHMNEFDE